MLVVSYADNHILTTCENAADASSDYAKTPEDSRPAAVAGRLRGRELSNLEFMPALDTERNGRDAAILDWLRWGGCRLSNLEVYLDLPEAVQA